MSTLTAPNAKIITSLNTATLDAPMIEAVYKILNAAAQKINGFKVPWNLQNLRADVQVAKWLALEENKGVAKTYAEIAEGMAEEYPGATEDTIEQIVNKDQANVLDKDGKDTGKKKQGYKFTVANGKVSLRVKTAKVATINLFKTA